MPEKSDEQIQEKIKEKAIEKLREIYDPEIPVNIYDLGLIYEMEVDEQNEIAIEMTLTAPNCPVADNIVNQVEFDLKEIPEVKDAKVTLTFEPPWNPDNLSDEAKLELGML